MNYWIPLIEIILAYLIGSIPSAVWVGKMFYKTDVREHGSGNAGATNVIRVLGYKAGIPVMLFDIFKGWFAVHLVYLFPHDTITPVNLTWLRIILAIAVVFGHLFPVFAGFKGGKGVGTLAGVAIALYPIALLIVLGIFVVTLLISRYVSLSSILAGISFPFIVIFITGQTHHGLMLLTIFVGFFIPATHIKNIKRLMKGTENKFLFKRPSA